MMIKYLKKRKRGQGVVWVTKWKAARNTRRKKRVPGINKTFPLSIRAYGEHCSSEACSRGRAAEEYNAVASAYE